MKKLRKNNQEGQSTLISNSNSDLANDVSNVGNCLTFIIDLDDTLIKTHISFERAKESFIDLMTKLGFKERDARVVFQSVDLGNIAKLGFVPERYQVSMQEAYESLCALSHQSVDEKILAHINDIAKPVWDGPFPLSDGVLQTLEYLKEHRCTLVLYTRGSTDLQMRKIRDAGISNYFTAIYIVPQKTTESLATILADLDLAPTQTWVVGDGIRSDVNPAIELSLNAVLVEGQTWSYEETELLDKNVYRIKSFAELSSLFRSTARSPMDPPTLAPPNLRG